jgi:hypothetical protein
MTLGVLSAGVVGIKQLGFLMACGDLGCGGPRLSDQILLTGAVGAASVGGWKMGRHAAYRDTVLGNAAKPARTRLIAGGVLLGVGLTAMAVDMGLMAQCQLNAAGPYAGESSDFGWTDCTSNGGAVALDLGALSAAIGGGLLGYTLAYRRDRAAYDRGRVVVSPVASRRNMGLQISGSF